MLLQSWGQDSIPHCSTVQRLLSLFLSFFLRSPCFVHQPVTRVTNPSIFCTHWSCFFLKHCAWKDITLYPESFSNMMKQEKTILFIFNIVPLFCRNFGWRVWTWFLAFWPSSTSPTWAPCLTLDLMKMWKQWEHLSSVTQPFLPCHVGKQML